MLFSNTLLLAIAGTAVYAEAASETTLFEKTSNKVWERLLKRNQQASLSNKAPPTIPTTAPPPKPTVTLTLPLTTTSATSTVPTVTLTSPLPTTSSLSLPLPIVSLTSTVPTTTLLPTTSLSVPDHTTSLGPPPITAWTRTTTEYVATSCNTAGRCTTTTLVVTYLTRVEM